MPSLPRSGRRSWASSENGLTSVTQARDERIGGRRCVWRNVRGRLSTAHLRPAATQTWGQQARRLAFRALFRGKKRAKEARANRAGSTKGMRGRRRQNREVMANKRRTYNLSESAFRRRWRRMDCVGRGGRRGSSEGCGGHNQCRERGGRARRRSATSPPPWHNPRLESVSIVKFSSADARFDRNAD